MAGTLAPSGVLKNPPPMGTSEICTARGKTILVFVQDTSKLVFEFPLVLSLSNSRNRVLMKFTS